MKSIFALLCLALLATTVYAADESSDVVVLKEDNFDENIKANPITLVEFFAPWCGHCKALAPNYAKAATALKGTAVLASVDCTDQRDLCSRFGVQGFPTLKVFRNTADISSPAEYMGGRTDKDIIKYMQKQTEPAYVEVKSEDELTAFLGKDGVRILGLFSSLDADEAKAFLGAAEELRNDYAFAVSTSSDMATKYGATAPALVLFKNEGGEDVTVVTSEAAQVASQSAQKEWINAEAFELVGEIGPENFQKYLDRGLPLVWSFVDYKAESKEATDKVLAALSEAAKAVKGKLSVVKLDGHRWGEHAKHFGLSGSLPGIVVEDRDNNKNYVFPESNTVSAQALKEHFEGFLAGTIQPTLKSQPEPTENDGPVTVVVGTTFESIVMDDTKDVLVEFYAPWCGHCKSLAPKYDKLGEEFKDDSNVVIAKVDATENDTPARIEGFPTLIFYPAGAKSNPVNYEGDRTVEAMAEFVRTNRKSTPATAADKPRDEL